VPFDDKPRTETASEEDRSTTEINARERGEEDEDEMDEEEWEVEDDEEDEGEDDGVGFANEEEEEPSDDTLYYDCELYLQGLLWHFRMYADGYCPDYNFSYP